MATMKYKYTFRIHKPTNSLKIDILGKASWLSSSIDLVRTYEHYNLIKDEIAKIKQGKKKESAIWWEELGGILFRKNYCYYFEGPYFEGEQNDIFFDLKIETEEFEKLLEVWWKEYVKVEDKPQC